jgi:DNA-binding LacI/PurR family transcriptional regulator
MVEIHTPSGGPRASTIYDVAKLAQVSHQTVSRLVKGHTNIRPEIRVRVEAAIEALNYRPNMSARSLATSRSHRIGALVYEIVEVGPAKIMEGAAAGAREAGYLLDIVSLDPHDDRAIQQSIGLINQHDLAGVMVFAPTDGVMSAVEKNVHFSVPVYVESDAIEPGVSGPTLNEQGVGLILDHLIAWGHRRFFHIAGPTDWFAARGRHRAYEEVLIARGLQSMGVLHGDWTSRSGYDAALSMPLDQGITAVIASNDQMALGVLAAFDKRSVRVPEDISVVGFDDIPESRYFHPPLTTVRLDFDRQGRIAIDRLLRMIDGARVADPIAELKPELFVRASTGPASGRK